MEGLLRKYKISKISDNVKLTERELAIIEFFDNRLSGLNISLFNKNTKLFSTQLNKRVIFEYSTCTKVLYVRSHLTYDIETIMKINFFDYSVRLLIKEWVESLYCLDIKYIRYLGRELERVGV